MDTLLPVMVALMLAGEVQENPKEQVSPTPPVKQEEPVKPVKSTLLQPHPQPPRDSVAIQPGTAGLSNMKHQWWYQRGYDQAPSTVEPQFADLLETYGGIFQGDTSRKAIYLTFDEGYENGYTTSILDTLAINGVKTVFFITKSYLDENPELVKRMVREGHVVGNHTVHHPSLPDLSVERVVAEFQDLEDAFYELTGQRMKYMRPPQGDYSELVLSVAQQMGYHTVFWSLAFHDWEVTLQRGADYAHDVVMDQLHPGAVLLLHAVSHDNAAALDSIIHDAREAGYIFEPLDVLTAPKITIKVNGKAIHFNQPPIQVNEQTLVPVRQIFEGLGAQVVWEAETKTIRATRGANSLTMKMGDPTALVNGEPQLVDPPAQIINDRAVVPVRFVAEALGAKVSWHEPSNSILITTPPPPEEKPQAAQG